MPNYTDHKYVIEQIGKAQDADHDNREKVREAHLFVDKRNGQWEPYWWDANSGKPRYTFDMTTPIIDQISGEMSQADFDIQVKPAGGEASKDTARLFDGLIRNIENVSNANHIFNCAGRAMVTSGLSGWRVVQKFVDSDSFDQDLVIEPLSNFVDRVWFDPNSELQDRSDARWCVVLQAISKEEYSERWPDGSEKSVTTDRQGQAYHHQAESVIVGEFYFKQSYTRELVLMSNGQVFEVNDDYERVQIELLQLGVQEVRRRKRDATRVLVRKFDGGDWLEEQQETVFSHLPVVPCYANFSIFENKTIYHGVVEKLIDQQRVMNYSLSREIEEGALAPRAKWWMTQVQAAGHEKTLRTLNTNADPVQFYNHDPDVPGVPQQNGGAVINPGLNRISETMRQMMGQVAGMFAANMGDNPGLQSGVAIEKLQQRGDNSTVKYFEAMENAICYTARVLVDAIPKVYESERMVRILDEDGSFDMVQLNQRVIDAQTQEIITLNDLSKGQYDVTCQAGPSFRSRQAETVSAITEIAQVDPSVIQMGSDILLNNVTAPGVELIAERMRLQKFQAGLIPPGQWTEEEQAEVQRIQEQQANQPAQPDPATLLAQAEMIKAQNEQAETQIGVQEKSAKIQLQARKEDREDQKLMLQAQGQQQQAENAQLQQVINMQQMQMQEQAQQFDQMMKAQQQQLAEQSAVFENIKTQAETLNTIRSAMGVDSMIGPGNTEAYINQAEELNESIDNQ